MNDCLYEIHRNGAVVVYQDEEVFLGVIESLLKFNEMFFVRILKTASSVLEQLQAILLKHDLKIAFTADSPPEARDYVANALAGAVAGGAVGLAVGGAAWYLLGDLVFPGLGTALAIFGTGGAAAGAVLGGAATVWGLKVHFERVGDQNALAMQFAKGEPQPASGG